MPDVENMKTNLNIQFFGCSAREQSTWKRLYQAHQNLEMNLSSIGNDDRRTRQGYKTSQIRQACTLMEELAANLNVHHLVIERAQEEFAKYREAREAVHQFEGCVAACVVIAYEELLNEVGDKIHKNATSFEVKQDIGKIDGDPSKAFGVVLPHSQVRNDVAISSLPGVPMGKFSQLQVMDWLYAVAGSGSGSSKTGGRVLMSDAVFQNRIYATMLGKYIAMMMRNQNLELQKQSSKISSGPAAKKVSTAGIFGVTTISGRNKQQAKSDKGVSEGVSQLTAGQHLIRTKVAEVCLKYELDTNNELVERAINGARNINNRAAELRCEKLFHDAIRRRAHYDALKAESDRVLGLQQKRLRKETVEDISTLGMNGYKQKSSSSNSNKNHVNGKEKKQDEGEYVTSIEDIDLEELVGGPILSETVPAPSGGGGDGENDEEGGIVELTDDGGMEAKMDTMPSVASIPPSSVPTATNVVIQGKIEASSSLSLPAMNSESKKRSILEMETSSKSFNGTIKQESSSIAADSTMKVKLKVPKPRFVVKM
mmetsp:Transcript_9923/g.13621  ORF Transcript_9923/g.13621 Transcript_9923/m.13621 type:complete len:540 (-) Transcript_9923:689-2308(-)